MSVISATRVYAFDIFFIIIQKHMIIKKIANDLNLCNCCDMTIIFLAERQRTQQLRRYARLRQKNYGHITHSISFYYNTKTYDNKKDIK